MSAREVNDVDVVTNASSVWCLVVVSEDGDLFTDACCYLADEGEEVIWVFWVFADFSGWVGADWIKVSEDDDSPLVSDVGVYEDLFHHDF